MTDVSAENAASREQALERLRLKRAAYVALFGPPGEPTPHGAVVLEDLDRFCRSFDESVHFDSSGRLDPYTTIYRDGKKAVALRIRQMLEWSDINGDSSGSSESGADGFIDSGGYAGPAE